MAEPFHVPSTDIISLELDDNYFEKRKQRSLQKRSRSKPQRQRDQLIVSVIPDLKTESEVVEFFSKKYANSFKYVSQLLKSLKKVALTKMPPPYALQLNLYNLLNTEVLSNIGMGFYHTGIQILGLEIAFGGHQYDETGIYAILPRSLDMATFKKCIYVAHCYKSALDLVDILLQLAVDFRGKDYDILGNNCNDFSNEACLRLCNKPIPRFVNRAAKVGRVFKRSKVSVAGGLADVVGYQGAATDVETTAPEDSAVSAPVVAKPRRTRMLD